MFRRSRKNGLSLEGFWTNKPLLMGDMSSPGLSFLVGSSLLKLARAKNIKGRSISIFVVFRCIVTFNIFVVFEIIDGEPKKESFLDEKKLF